MIIKYIQIKPDGCNNVPGNYLPKSLRIILHYSFQLFHGTLRGPYFIEMGHNELSEIRV